MIHYTLLPEKELRMLKREYRIRLLIFSIFFTSIAVLIGILSLIPAYMLSYTEEKEALDSIESLRKNRKQSGLDVITAELKQSDIILKKINSFGKSVPFSQSVSTVLGNRVPGITLHSFQFLNSINTASSTMSFTIQGKSGTREALVAFKNKLEADPAVLKVELPVSDLVKSRDISFSIKLSMTIPQ